MTTPPTVLNFARPDLDDATIASVVDVLRSGWITTGKRVQELEAALSRSLGGRPTRLVTSATAGLDIAVEVCGVGAGDEVIMSSQSFFSAMNVVAKRGAMPVFVDCDLESRAIDLVQVERAITPKTRVIIPTHFPGKLVDMDRLLALAAKYKLRVIEDAALVQGSHWQGSPIGSFGDIAVLSFHPNKNMTTIEGGAIVLNAAAESVLIEKLRFHGINKLADGTRDVEMPAGKYNISDVSAAIGLHQLRHLPAFLEKRRALVAHYFRVFPTIPGAVLPDPDSLDQSWNMFSVLIPFTKLGITRREFQRRLQDAGVATGISYEANHLTSLGRQLGYRSGQFPNSERIGAETVTLPLHTGMETPDIDRVCQTIVEVLGLC
jgi:dTDP-4-amino-4,6-dideoxygalactose transaminase